MKIFRRKKGRYSFRRSRTAKQAFVLFCVFVSALYIYAAVLIITDQYYLITSSGGRGGFALTSVWNGYSYLLLAVLLSGLLIWIYLAD